MGIKVLSCPDIQISIIMSLWLALFTLAAGLLWDQKDGFLISYRGRPHPEVWLTAD